MLDIWYDRILPAAVATVCVVSLSRDETRFVSVNGILESRKIEKKTQQKKNEKWKENRTQTVPKIDYIVSQLQLSFPDVRIRHRTLSPRLIRGIQFPNSVHRSNEIIFVWMCGCVLRISNWIGRHDRQALQQCDDVTVWHKQPHRVWLTSARTTNDMNMTIK